MESFQHEKSCLPSFLGLPHLVRKRIYSYTGLITGLNIDLNGHRVNYGYSWLPGPNFEDTPNLLFVCQSVYLEVSSIVYSTNRFFIRYKDNCEVSGLRGLEALTASSVGHLTYLSVHHLIIFKRHTL